MAVHFILGKRISFLQLSVLLTSLSPALAESEKYGMQSEDVGPDQGPVQKAELKGRLSFRPGPQPANWETAVGG